MLPTVEQTQTVGTSFPRGRVAFRCAPAATSAALVLGPRTVADLVVELRAETRTTSSMPRHTWREAVEASSIRDGP